MIVSVFDNANKWHLLTDNLFTSIQFGLCQESPDLALINKHEAKRAEFQRWGESDCLWHHGSHWLSMALRSSDETESNWHEEGNTPMLGVVPFIPGLQCRKSSEQCLKLHHPEGIFINNLPSLYRSQVGELVSEYAKSNSICKSSANEAFHAHMQ